MTGAFPSTTDRYPARVPLARRPLGILGSAMTARRNVLELIPELAVRQPMVSGTLGIRWHMVMDPDALRRVQSAIGNLHQGLEPTDALIQRFLDYKLLEPIDISLSFDNGETLRLDGLYTVSLDRLHALPDASVLTMFRCGDLQLAYAQSASVRHLRTLARRRNDSLVNVPR